MKHFLTLILVGALLLSLSACAENPAETQPSTPSGTPSTPQERPSIPSVPDGTMPSATTPAGEPVPDIPMDFEQAAGQLGADADTYYNPSSDSSVAENIAISSEDVLYQSVTKLEYDFDGFTYRYTININHVGKVTKTSGKIKYIQFSAAYLTMSFPDENAEQTKQFLLDSLPDSPLTEDSKEAYRQLIGGAKIYIAADSGLWDTFVSVPVNSKIVFDNETFHFYSDGEGNGDGHQLYHDYIRDNQDRDLKHTAYYFDNDGTKWIESIDEYEYYENGHRHTQTYYHLYSTQIHTYYVGLVNFDGENTTTFKELETREYYIDGSPKSASYRDENDNLVEYQYTEEGIKTYEHYTDAEGTVITVNYQGDGTLISRYTTKLDGTESEEMYTPDGTLSYMIVRRNDTLVEEYGTFPNGNPQRHSFYYENGRPHISKFYYEHGGLESIYEYYDTEELTPKRIEYYSGEFLTQVNNYYPNGVEQNMTMYFFRESADEEYRIWKYSENYENGESAKYQEFDQDGQLLDGREYFENGEWKYGYSLMEDGTVDEMFFHENGQMKKSVTVNPDGRHFIQEWNEDGTNKYDYRNFGNGESIEWIYDEKGQMTHSNETYEDGGWSRSEYFGYYENGQVKQTKSINSDGYEYQYDYYENGQYGRSYTKFPDGSIRIVYFDENGNFQRIEEF